MVAVCLAALDGGVVGQVVPAGGRIRANSYVEMSAPVAAGDTPVLIEILDPWRQRVWSGAARGETFAFFTRDWADGAYTIRFEPGGERTVHVESEYFGRVVARAGLMLREIERLRDADGMAPDKLAGTSNLLQRVMTLFVYDLPKEQVEEHLDFCERQLGFRTQTATVRVLGSGASDFMGYDHPYRPGARERSMMFMPPDAVFDFAANGERKLERWGYGVKDVRHVFISHSHADHFDAEAIVRFAEKRREVGLPALEVHSGPAVCGRLRALLEERNAPGLLTLDELRPGRETKAGELTVKAVEARHTDEPVPLCYIARYRGATVYYGTDSGYAYAVTLEAMSKERFDVFAPECTVASGDDGVTHMDLGDVLLLVGKLRRAGAIDAWTRVVTIHQSRDGLPSHTGYNPWERAVGLECGYDGMPLPIAFRLESEPRP